MPRVCITFKTRRHYSSDLSTVFFTKTQECQPRIQVHRHQAQRACHCTPTRTEASLTLFVLHSVYVRNLEERIKIPELVEALTELFSEYGTILEVVAKKNLKAKGQAFIVFDDPESAEKAIEEVQGFEIFGKEMKLEKARTKSDAFIEQKEGPEALEKWKRVRGGEKGMSCNWSAASFPDH